MDAFASPEILQKMVAAQKQGIPAGIASICSANRFVLEAAMRRAGREDNFLLVEATCNQVNQFGGYTGQTPADFSGWLAKLAEQMNFPAGKLILGGDHLGPNPWQALRAEEAMANARVMVQDFVRAGFRKIHLDASMRLASDPQDRPLDPVISARRAAELCAAAREAARGQPLVYVIGTEVPIPGGAQEHEDALEVTAVSSARETLALFRDTFRAQGLGDAWEEVIALVVQPGVEFGDDNLFEYNPLPARPLADWIETVPGIVFEAHSTDYQTAEALRSLVADHFAILKVGPELTFAFREAVFALARMEQELYGEQEGMRLSNLIQTVEAAMLDDPLYWRKYYHGGTQARAFARKYSYSDRIRYYWPRPKVAAALEILLDNLSGRPLPLPLVSQYLPVQYRHLRAGTLENHPRALIWDHIEETLARYAYACEGK